MTKDEALDLALEALESYKNFIEDAHILEGQWHWLDGADKAITAIKQVRSAPVQDSTCSEALRAQGKAYPRTCRKCGKGPCIALANAALDKMADNARELGLDYENVQPCNPAEDGVCESVECNCTTPPASQRQWVGLTDEEIRRIACGDVECWSLSEAALFKSIARAIEAKLKEKNT